MYSSLIRPWASHRKNWKTLCSSNCRKINSQERFFVLFCKGIQTLTKKNATRFLKAFAMPRRTSHITITINREQEKREGVTVIHQPLNKHIYIATGGTAHNIKCIILSHGLAECCCSMLKIKTEELYYTRFLSCHLANFRFSTWTKENHFSSDQQG